MIEVELGGMPVTFKKSLLFGRSRARSVRYLGVSIAMFLGALGFMFLIWVLAQQNIGAPLSGLWLMWTVALIVVGVPAIHAYQNDGLLVSIALGLAIPLAFYLVLTRYNLVYPSEDILWGIGSALKYGVPAGILGFLLGVGFRLDREWRSSERSQSRV